MPLEPPLQTGEEGKYLKSVAHLHYETAL